MSLEVGVSCSRRLGLVDSARAMSSRFSLVYKPRNAHSLLAVLVLLLVIGTAMDWHHHSTALGYGTA